MGLKVLAIQAALLAILLAPCQVSAQSTGQSGANRAGANRQHTSASTPSRATPQIVDAAFSPGADSDAAPRVTEPAPRVTVSNPAPSAAPWPLHEKISWAANLVLVVLGYAGIMMALSLLKKIDRQTAYAEAAAEAAASSAHAALLNAQATIHSERPWLLITVEPSRSVENSFTITATNRGRTPAIVTATVEFTAIAANESHLPSTPDYRQEEPSAPQVPVILVPGESTPIKTFCRDEVKALCDSEERFRRIETWEEKIFLYGKVEYIDLISAQDDQNHETGWCCWYIHGRQNSGLVLAGPLSYNAHT
jgi:hypothetical protein